jgi:beta-galactosidase/beta-glucuronidase
LQVTRQFLDTGWRVREVASPETPEHTQLSWLPAQVPGQVHLDLMRAGVIPDPFQRLYERDVAWVSESDWEYETTFTLSSPPPAHAFLLFHGLDTVAEISLNGELLAKTDNMYVPQEFPVDGRLRAGENHLSILFRSALRVGRERLREWGDSRLATDPFPGNWDRWASRSFVRKAQYMFGWDWGPVLPSCGLWRPVELVVVPTARLTDWKHDVEFTADGKAVVTITADIERSPDAADVPLQFFANINSMRRASLEDFDPELSLGFGFEYTEMDVQADAVSVPTGAGRQTVAASLTIDAPVRWEPNGVGGLAHYGPALYELVFSLGDDDMNLDQRTAQIGLRTL